MPTDTLTQHAATQGEIERPAANPLQRGMVAQVLHESGYVERVYVQGSAQERDCDLCEADIQRGEMHGVNRALGYHFCFRHCEPIPAAAVERERAERQALAQVHEAALEQQLRHVPWGSTHDLGIVFWQQYHVGHWRWDFLIAGRHGSVLVDIQGATRAGHRGAHTSHDGYTRDCEKLAAAVIAGYRAVFVTGEQVKNGRALQLVELLLRGEK